MQYTMALMLLAMFPRSYTIARIARLFGISTHSGLNKGDRAIHRLLLLTE